MACDLRRYMAGFSSANTNQEHAEPSWARTHLADRFEPYSAWPIGICDGAIKVWRFAMPR
ncbi:MAG: hypothetical protein CMJ21_00375 [Phycisphaerae bacterium]|nr:hypothetical protein [Phycisphaerae bacterium]